MVLADRHALHLREPSGAQGDSCDRHRRPRSPAVHRRACMPNTAPVNDNANVTALILAKAAEAALARAYPIGAVSKDRREKFADIAELKDAGCVAITDDGHPVSTALLLRRALEYAGMFGCRSSSTAKTRV